MPGYRVVMSQNEFGIIAKERKAGKTLHAVPHSAYDSVMRQSTSSKCCNATLREWKRRRGGTLV